MYFTADCTHVYLCMFVPTYVYTYIHVHVHPHVYVHIRKCMPVPRNRHTSGQPPHLLNYVPPLCSELHWGTIGNVNDPLYLIFCSIYLQSTLLPYTYKYVCSVVCVCVGLLRSLIPRRVPSCITSWSLKMMCLLHDAG